MEKYIFSYKNDSREIITLVIEPWLMIYEIKPCSTIIFTYTSNERKIDVIGVGNSSINIYFDFDQIKVVLDDKDITMQYPLNKLME